MMRRIGLFAAREMGCRIATLFGERRVPASCVVVDAADDESLRQRIVQGCGAEQVFRSDELRSGEVLDRMDALDLDLIVLAWWPHLIKAPLLQMPRLGCLNLHPSLLPHNRGKDYNFWNLVEDVPFGVTIHWVDEGVDSGPVAFQAAIEKSWEDTGETLYLKAQTALEALFREQFDRIGQGEIPREPQRLEQGSFHRRSELEPASRLDLDRPTTARALLNLLRARTFPPHPAAWFEEAGRRYEVRVEIRRRKA
jgi:methionyl-tRNA formyltransferase